MDEAKVTSAILKHIENNFETTELDGWSVEFEGIEDDDGNLTTPAQDQENGWSRFVVTKVDDGSVFYVIWDYPSKSISEFNEG